MFFVPVHSLNRNQVVAEASRAKVTGREAMITGISFWWTLTVEQILSLAVVRLNIVPWRSRNGQLQESCSAPEAQVKPYLDYMKF